MLTLNDGRSELWQWDTGRKLTVDADCSQVHFSNKIFGRSIDVNVVDGVAIIPDVLLQTDKDLNVWAFVGTAENGYTKISKTFKVNRRNKPADYVFTPPDQTSLEEIKEKIEYLESIQDPDAIKNAVDDYLANNPIMVKETDPTVPEWAKQPTPPDVKIPDKLPNPHSITFTGAVDASYDGSNPVEIKIPDSGGNVDYVGIEPAYDDIPKIFFGGALQQTKDEAVVPFRYISKTDDFSGYAEIKAQGNSSMSYPKKNQTVKMFKDEACDSKMKVNFKGWGKQNKHVYKANWIDMTHARNVVSARLWADVVKTRTNYADLPELLRTSPNQGAVDGFPVKVYAAGVYQGRYTLNIPKDKWTFNMDDNLDNHCVLCGENYASGCFRAVAQINESDWTDEIHDVVPASIKTRWNEVISFVMNSTDEEFRANLSQYFYVDSLIDYYLFGLASCGLDAFGKNQIYMTYDGQKWIASMYDMDSTWGLYWNGSKFVATDYARTSYEDMVNGRQGNLLYMRLEQLFYEELQTRWAELKNGALSIANIINRFERFTDIAPAELVKEDYASTTGGGEFTGIPSKDTNNIQQIRSFALARQEWTDAYVFALTGGGEQPDPEQPEEPEVPDTGVPCTGITLDKSELLFTGEGTQTITATVTPADTTDTVVWISSNPAVAAITVEGNVCTVQSVNNGNAVITVTCGNYSVSCSVSVSGMAAALLYSLTEATDFDGVDDYIDTGIQLFDTPKDFTLLLRGDFSRATTSDATVLHCMQELTPYPGFSIAVSDGGNYRCASASAVNKFNPKKTISIAITAQQGVISAIRTFGVDGITESVFSGATYSPVDKNLLLGCYQDVNGNKGRYWKGTIDEFKVWNAVLTDEEIDEKLYALSDGELYADYSPDGASFSRPVCVDFDAGYYIEAEIDTTGCTGTNENVFSIGKDIAVYRGGCFHLYYTKTTGALRISAAETNGYVNYDTQVESGVMTVRFDKDGLSINGTLITSNSFNSSTYYETVLSDILAARAIGIGSAEGNTRSNATYNFIRVGVDN